MINKSELMKKAWLIKRETGFTFSDALRMAWAFVKLQSSKLVSEVKLWITSNIARVYDGKGFLQLKSGVFTVGGGRNRFNISRALNMNGVK